MMIILQQMQCDPQTLQQYVKNQDIMLKVMKLSLNTERKKRRGRWRSRRL